MDDNKQATGIPKDALFASEKQFCESFGLCRRTVQRWRVSGDGPKWSRLGAKRVAYRISDIEAWAAARTFNHRAEEFAGA